MPKHGRTICIIIRLVVVDVNLKICVSIQIPVLFIYLVFCLVLFVLCLVSNVACVSGIIYIYRVEFGLPEICTILFRLCSSQHVYLSLFRGQLK